MDYDLITLPGRYAKERNVERRRLAHGVQGVESKRGVSGHAQNPFAALAARGADEEHGWVYGFNLVYSGNFSILAECDFNDSTRLIAGINPTDFEWTLAPGEAFDAPECVLVFTPDGLGEMSRIFHRFYRENLIRGRWKHEKRPLLINSWEAAYFDFDTEKLAAFAKEAKTLGVEMLVMDDGWFGNRFDDNRALGDWVVNEEKLHGGHKYLVDEVNKRGMKFGIWFEPEMICPDSDLYREHPDWAIQIEGREPGCARNQLVLDYTRDDVTDHIYNKVASVLRSANVEYVKWDMNRPLADIGSATLPAEKMGEFYHRYVMGVYKLQERLITDFPNLLLENCSSGGGRFDAGMLYYSPQIWASDDADAVERLKIQEGTELIYPMSTMGAHVSDCPNHCVGRTTPFRTRGHVALSGTFGYELDVTRIPEADRNMIPEQVKMYHKFNDLVRTGDYYRIDSYSLNGSFDAWMSIKKDKSEALLTAVMVLKRPNVKSSTVRLKGLEPDKKYRLLNEDGTEYTTGMAGKEDVRTYSGALLMKGGIHISETWGDYQSILIHIKEA
jgi:alpha-galactosidase